MPKKRIKPPDTPPKPKASVMPRAIAQSMLLEEAARGEHEKCRKIFEGRRDRPLNGGNEEGMTAIHLASQGGHVETVQLLLDMQLDDEARDKNGRTPLHIAAAAGHTAVVELLLDIGTDVDARAGPALKQWTPLMFAAAHGRVAAIGALLVADSELLDALDSDGNNAATIAQQHKKSAAADALEIATEARRVRSRKQQEAEAAQKKAMLQRRSSRRLSVSFHSDGALGASGDAAENRRSSSRSSLGKVEQPRSNAMRRLSLGFRRVSAEASAMASAIASKRHSASDVETNVSIEPPALQQSNSSPTRRRKSVTLDC